jgi:hypothetical protein
MKRAVCVEEQTVGDERLSGFALREAVQRAGLSLGYEQLNDYVQWGFIEQPQEGRWPADHIETIATRIRAVRDLERYSRSLPRRAILLSPYWRANRGYEPTDETLQDFRPIPSGYTGIREAANDQHVPVESLRAAMLDVLPTIYRPSEAMLQLHFACHYHAREYPWPRWILPRKPGDRFPFYPPAVQEGAAVLAETDAERITERRWLWYDLASFLFDETAETPDDVTAIPAEDTVILLAIRDLATNPPPLALDEAQGERRFFPIGADDPVIARQRARRSRVSRDAAARSDTPGSSTTPG